MIFPLPSFNAVVCPVNTAPLVGNAEIVRVTAVAGDTFTIARTQEGSNARAIQAGDQIYAAITAKTLNDAEALTPIGEMKMWPVAAPPVNFLLCDGTQYLNSAFPALAAVLGTTYGGDASHFNVPNLTGRFPLGKAAAGTGSALGATGGQIDHAHSVPGLVIPSLGASVTVPDHIHGLTSAHVPIYVGQFGAVDFIQIICDASPTYSGLYQSSYTRQAGASGITSNGSTRVNGTTDGSGAIGASGATSSGTTNSGTSGSSNPPFQVVNYIIRAK